MPARFKSVDAATAKVIFDSGAHMIDVRSRDEWAAGHVEGSDRVASSDVNSKTVGRADAVITVCRDGSKSKRAAKKLAKEGYRVYHLSGGLEAWNDIGLGLVSSNGGRASII
jgi:rhodanese-related sulfurtransferase